MDNIYPIGSIFISTLNTNPSTYFGGTWERIKGRFLLAADDSSYTLGATGGAATHTLVESELPVITGSCSGVLTYGSNARGHMTATKENSIGGTGSSNHWSTLGYSFGGGKAHNNMPPYLVVYIWKRVS